MKVQVLLTVAGLMIVGCTQNPPAPMGQTGKPANAPAKEGAVVGAAAATSEPAALTGDGSVALTNGAAVLSPDNSKVIFVGAHVGEKPDPRTGGFEKFSGKLTTEGGKLTAVSLAIATDSTWTEIGGKLTTTHLKSPDFLDSKEFPEIKFQSTKVETADDGKATITGDLTLHGETKPITIPATVKVTDKAISLSAEFVVDRSEFGITTATDKVEKSVDLKIVVGEKTEAKPGPAE